MAQTDWKQRRDFAVHVVGDEDVGKTSFLRRILDTSKDYEERLDQDMGSGLTFASGSAILGNVWIQLLLITRYAAYYDKYLEEFGKHKGVVEVTKGIIYMFSLSDEKSFKNIPKWVQKATKAFGRLPGLLVGNKADLKTERVVSREAAEKQAKKLGLHYLETSILDGPLLGTEFESFSEDLVKKRWPEWSPGFPLPLEQLEPEIQAAVEKREKDVIALLEKYAVQEDEAVRKFRSGRNHIQHAGMKVFLEQHAGGSESNAEWARLMLEGLRTSAFNGMFAKFWRIFPLRHRVDALRRMEALYQDAVVAVDDEYLKQGLLRLLGEVRSTINHLKFDATATEASLTSTS